MTAVEASTMEQLTISLLGPFQVVLNDDRINGFWSCYTLERVSEIPIIMPMMIEISIMMIKFDKLISIMVTSFFYKLLRLSPDKYFDCLAYLDRVTANLSCQLGLPSVHVY